MIRSFSMGRPVVPDHDVLRRIGVGGQGEVWLARSVTGAWRAVKVLYRDRFDDERTYRREFEAVRRFEGLSREHVGFADILQTGWGEKEQYYYYLMELADGVCEPWTPEDYEPMTLARLVRERGRLPVTTCIDLGLALGTGLMALHREKLIHRDLKPSNVIYVGGVPKLVDIGLLIGTHEARSYVGTEGFIAPEGPNSARADIYGLGKLLYMAVTGKDRRDFPDPGVEMESGPEARTLREFNLILLKACAADPGRRYPTAEACVDDLGRIRDGGSIRWVRRRADGMRWLQKGGRAAVVWGGVAALAWTAWRWVSVGERPGGKAGRPLANPASDSQGELIRRRAVDEHLSKGRALMDSGDDAAALVHFTEALPMMTPGTPEERANRIRIRQVQDILPRLARVLKSPGVALSSVFSPDGHQISILDASGNVCVWDLATGAKVFERTHPGGLVGGIRYTRDGRHLMVTPPGMDSRAQPLHGNRKGLVLDARSGNVWGTECIATGALEFLGDGREVVLAKPDGLIEIRDVASAQVRMELKGHTAAVSRLVVSADARLLGSADINGGVRLWQLTEGKEILRIQEPKRWIRSLTFHPDGRRLMIATDEGSNQSSLETVEFGGAPDGVGGGLGTRYRTAGRLEALDPRLQRGHWLLMGLDGEHTSVESPEGWTIREASDPGSVVRKIPLAGRIRCWALSPDGLWLVLGGDGGARVWDVETGEAVTGLLGHAGGVRSVDFSPEGSRLVTGGVDGVVKVWDLKGIRALEKRVTLSGRVINLWRSFEGYPAAVGGDRQLVLAVRQDGRQTAVQMDLDTGRELPMPDYPGSLTCGAVLSGHTAGVWAIYDPEADPPSSSPQVGLWRQTGKTWKWTRLPHPVRVVGAAFDASDSRLVTLDASNGLRSWDVSRGALLFQTNLPGALGNAIMSKGAARWVQLGESNRLVTVSRLDGREVGTSTVRLEGAVDGMGISPDAGRLSLAMRDGSLRVLNLESAQSQRLPSGWLPTPVAMEWDGRGSRLIVQAASGAAQIVDFRADAIQSVAGTGGGFPRTRVTFGQEDGWAVVRGEDESVWVIDVASGHPVSRKLRHAGRVRFSTVTRGGQWVTVSDPDQVWMGRMDPASDSVETLQRHARLGAGRQISRSGKLDWIEVPALIAMAGGAGQEGEAGTESQRLAAWQWERAGRPRTLLQAEAARFHLVQLEKGSNSPAEETRPGMGEMETAALPDRFPGTDRRLVDLSVFYTHSFPGLADRPLASLPVGPSRIGSVDYDLRGLIRLEPAAYADQVRMGGLVAPDSIPLTRCAGIPIQQTCRRIHFLMGLDGPLARMDHPVARWRIRYEGDAVREFPVVYGRQVYEWTSNPLSGKPGQVPHIAWMGRMPAPNGEQQAHLYAVEWENPEPGRKVAALDFVLGEENCRPFVVAITVE